MTDNRASKHIIISQFETARRVLKQKSEDFSEVISTQYIHGRCYFLFLNTAFITISSGHATSLQLITHYTPFTR